MKASRHSRYVEGELGSWCRKWRRRVCIWTGYLSVVRRSCLSNGFVRRTRRFTRQGGTSTWFQSVIESPTDTQQLGFLIRLDEILTQNAASSTYAGDRAGALSTVSTSPRRAHARSGIEGGKGWVASDSTLLHFAVESSCLLLHSIIFALLLSKSVPATTPLPVFFICR